MSAPSNDLFIDIGNTRIKWGYRNKGQWLTGSCDHNAFTALQWPFEIARVLVASVRDQLQLKQALEHQFGDRLVWLASPVKDYPAFQHCYQDSQRLGVDRWLAMLGAAHHWADDLLVVDAGTAVTLDLLNKQQQHLGGWIVPGLQLAQQALFQQTQRVNPYQDEEDASHAGPGQDTLSCVSSGVKRQLLMLVSSVIADYPQFKVFICGGDGEWLARELELSGMADVEIQFAPNLVFDGMESLCAGSFLP